MDGKTKLLLAQRDRLEELGRRVIETNDLWHRRIREFTDTYNKEDIEILIANLEASITEKDAALSALKDFLSELEEE